MKAEVCTLRRKKRGFKKKNKKKTKGKKIVRAYVFC